MPETAQNTAQDTAQHKTHETPGEESPGRLLFSVMNEIGIIQQLARAILERHLPDGLIEAHFAVLSHLSKKPNGEAAIIMARAMQMPKTSLSHTLKGLEARGLVATRPNPDDGRSKLVHVTPQGVALMQQTIAGLIESYAELPGAIGAERLGAVLPVLTDLRQWLDQERNQRDGF